VTTSCQPITPQGRDALRRARALVAADAQGDQALREHLAAGSGGAALRTADLAAVYSAAWGHAAYLLGQLLGVIGEA
jgi:hypothetical protein